MTAFRPGEIVDITIKGVRVVGHPSAPLVRIADEHGITFDMPPQAAVTRADPEFWPPAPGDLWRDGEGRVWFAQHRPGGVRMIPAELGEQDPLTVELPQHLLDHCGPMVRLWGVCPF